MDLSVVIPVYRSKETLQELHRRLVDALEAASLQFEIIFVEDCGGDDSWARIEALSASDTRVRGLRLSRNFGQHAATLCGMSVSTGRWVATIDDDLEQSPESLPELYARALEGCDLVYGVYPTRTHKAWRNTTSAMARWLFAKAIPSLNQEYTSFRVLRGELARELQRFDSAFPFIDGYLSWLTNRCAAVTVPHGSRDHGTSNYTLRKLVTHTINIFVTFSDLPLRMASWLGLFAFLGGMGWLALILAFYVLGGISVSGFSSVMAAILLFGGLQLLVLGIFGEYLGRMNFKLSHKPLFVVAEDTGAMRLRMDATRTGGP